MESCTIKFFDVIIIIREGFSKKNLPCFKFFLNIDLI